MPLTTQTWCGCRPSSAIASCNARSTPKSPHPGHQSGSTLPLKSLAVSGACLGFSTSMVAVVMVISPDFKLNNKFMYGHILLRLARQNFLHAVDDVMRHERFSVVLANVRLRHEARFRAQIARKL